MHTLHSVCGGYQEVENYVFVVTLTDGKAYTFKDGQDEQFDAYGTPVAIDALGMLIFPLVVTNVNADDVDAPTGGVGVVQAGEFSYYYEDISQRLVPFVSYVDGMLVYSTANLPVPTCQTGAKIDSEKCGPWWMQDPATGDMFANSVGNPYEINQTAATTHLIMKNSQDDISQEFLLWGTGWAGNIGDDPGMDGACAFFKVDKDEFMNAGYNGLWPTFDLLGGTTEAEWVDTGDAGCTASAANNTPVDAIQGEITIGFDPDTNRPLFLAKASIPDVTGGSLTPLNIFEEDSTLRCQAMFNAGMNRSPFVSGSGVVVADDGMIYTSATYFDADGKSRTGMVEVNPRDCSQRTLLELNYALVGGSMSDVTLAKNSKGETILMGAAGGYLYLMNVITNEYMTQALANTDQVIAGPVLDSAGHIVLMSKTNVMHIFNDIVDENNAVVIPLGDLSYSDHFWPRARQNNSGTGIREMVID